MNCNQETLSCPPPQSAPFPRSLLLLMARAITARAANLYYNQPLLPSIKDSFNLDDGAVGLIPTATQLGYAAVILLISPSGDVISRRSLIGYLPVLLTLALPAVFAAPSFFVQAIAFFAVGLGANSIQQLMPIRASLASPDRSPLYAPLPQGAFQAGIGAASARFASAPPALWNRPARHRVSDRWLFRAVRH
ncbi:MFS transporter [Loktanella salsilacus]|uniref:MFS transporter n=1 Tax=Loktanella salsilacus TaxID=195913 RepID=UPI003735D4E4